MMLYYSDSFQHHQYIELREWRIGLKQFYQRVSPVFGKEATVYRLYCFSVLPRQLKMKMLLFSPADFNYPPSSRCSKLGVVYPLHQQTTLLVFGVQKDPN